MRVFEARELVVRAALLLESAKLGSQISPDFDAEVERCEDNLDDAISVYVGVKREADSHGHKFKSQHILDADGKDIC